MIFMVMHRKGWRVSAGPPSVPGVNPRAHGAHGHVFQFLLIHGRTIWSAGEVMVMVFFGDDLLVTSWWIHGDENSINGDRKPL